MKLTDIEANKACKLLTYGFGPERVANHMKYDVAEVSALRAGTLNVDISAKYTFPPTFDESRDIPVFLDPHIYLEEATHTYIIHDDPTIKFISGTGLLHNLFDPFDGPAIATKLVATHWRYKDRTVKSLLDEWTQTSVDGNITHLELENYILSHRTTPVVTSKGLAAKPWIDKIWEQGIYDFYPEVIIYNLELGLSGMVDLILQDKKTKRLYMFDWKTCRTIAMASFKGLTRGIHPATMGMQDCHHSHYTLQMSLYQYMLELNYGPDYKCYQRHIVHLKQKDKYDKESPISLKLIPCAYLKFEIQNILDSLKAGDFRKH